MKVLITSPSLDETENVSGISTMIAGIIEHGGCDFVHFAVGRKDGEKFGLKWIATQLKLPSAVRRAIAWSKPDILHLNTAFEPRAIVRDLVIAKFGEKLPIVLHVHGGRFVMEEFSSRLIRSLAEKLLRQASRVIVLSEAEATNILKRSPNAKISILPNAVSTDDFPETEREWGTKTIIYLGRLQEAKGLSEIVEACRVLLSQGFKFRFTCFGTGPDQDEFFRRMKNVIGENFHYGGVVAGREKVQALNAADIFLMPSRFEGLPLALLEAMAAGCVPIVSNRGAIPSVVEDGRNGFLVDPGDLTQIVGKLKFLLSEGETGWNELRANARRTIQEEHDFREYSKKLEMIYVEALGRSDGVKV